MMMVDRKDFAGHLKKGATFLSDIEKQFIDRYVDKIPRFIQTYHLTWLGLVWIVLIIFFSFLARDNIQWMWAVSACILLQYLSDVFDGAIGRRRNTGLIKWGYYMDHFMDYLFLSAVLTGYSLLVSDQNKYLLFFILIIFGAFMVSSYLMFNITNELEIAYFKIGPTELRLLLILINTAIIFLGIRFFEEKILPYSIILPLIVLAVSVWRRQKRIFEIDLTEKERRAG